MVFRCGRLMPFYLAVLLVLVSAGAAYAADPAVAAGERIYLDGALPAGAALRGTREESGSAEGAVVACVNCHRRSGLGSAEGSTSIPPITAKYLYARAGARPVRQAGTSVTLAGADSDKGRAAYDDLSLAAAIRSGAGRGGRELRHVMPRYQLDDASMAALIDYLKTLPVDPSPGVSATTIDFATVVTPDADPVARDAMLAVLEQFIADKNGFIRGGVRPMQTNEQLRFRVTRRWHLHVWTLRGASSTWEAQLKSHLEAEPVFAVLSGIGGSDWSPVHRFCEAASLPCLFPNVALPVDAERDFYSLYFSKGVLLEAELIARQLAAPGGRRVVQVFVAGSAGEAAARHLGASLPAMKSILSPVVPGSKPGLAKAVAAAKSGDALVLWLGQEELSLLPAQPPESPTIYVSGILAGLEHAPLAADWRKLIEMTYPVDLPPSRSVRMNYPLRWFQIRHLAVTAEKVQADTYLACGIVSEALNDMLDSFMRDFLVERIESMVSHRQLSGYYPRLGLATGQRFASKGGYLVRFSDPTGTGIAATTDWVVP